MAELKQSIEDMLKEETWTRATISNYTENDLKSLANMVQQAIDENCEQEIYDICAEQLTHSKDSIIALYICGIHELKKGGLDNSNLETLVDIFQKNHKENVVLYLCESILNDDPDNKFALRTLADYYMEEKNEKVWDLYEKIVMIDLEEAELAKVLAEHFESLGEMNEAVSYFKKAIHRYINAKNKNACKEIWSKLVQYVPEEIDFFQHLRRQMIKNMNESFTTPLMQELYEWYKENKKWDTAIMILKQNLEVDPKDNWARNEITDCFRNKYAGHTNLEKYIKDANLEPKRGEGVSAYRNVFEAINDFEKHISFDKGVFVCHRTWGVGIIKSLENDNLKINFGRMGGLRDMKLSMAVTELKPLSRDHIWVLKATQHKSALAERIKKDKVWALKTIIKSFDNNCDLKRIKAELVPAILTPGEWTSWNTAAKKILESDSSFGVNPNDISMYTVKEGVISPAEKLSNEFKAQKQFFARADILMKYFEQILVKDFKNHEAKNSAELFQEMYNYFTGFVKNLSTSNLKVTDQVLASYLLVQEINVRQKELNFHLPVTFADLYKHIQDPRKIYTELKDSKTTHFKEAFLKAIKDFLPNWNEEYVRLFPTVLDMKLLDALISNGFKKDVQDLIKASFENCKDYREAVLFFFKECQSFDWFQEAGVTFEKQLIALINIIEITFREINNHVNSTENKKINKNATTLLFRDDSLYGYMFAEGSDEETVKRMYTLVDDIADIDPSYKAQARNQILEHYPEFKFRVSEEKIAQPKGMIVTAKKLEEKKNEADRIQNIELPANAKDVADARAKGDLKENAEYKAAKEQQHYLTLSLSKLQEELSRAVVFDPTTSTTAVVSFATVVTLENKDDGKDEVYTILGPWESDPDNNVISYMSPFGNAILDKKVGDDVQFEINEHKYHYVIKNIDKATNY